MTPKDYIENAVKTESVDWITIEKRMIALARVLHGSIGMADEAGEVLSIVKKAVFYGKGVSNCELVAAIKDEAGDVLWYMAILFDELGLTFEEVMASNVEKLKNRYKGGAFNPECVDVHIQCITCQKKLTVDTINIDSQCRDCAEIARTKRE